MRLDAMEDNDDVMIGDVTDVTPRGVSKRRANKHLIERRRRARINCSLTQLKALVLEGMRKDPARYTRLEKADVLELTVTHLRTVRSQRDAESGCGNPQLAGRYKAGFIECAQEISRFLTNLPEIEEAVRTNIMSHVEECVKRVKAPTGDNLDKTRSCSITVLDDPAYHDNSVQPLDLSVAGANRAKTEVEEMECYTIHKYSSTSDVESVTSSHDSDLQGNASPHDMQISHDARQNCPESVDSGVDDVESSSSVEQQDLKVDGGDGYQGEDDGMQLQDDAMWRPW